MTRNSTTRTKLLRTGAALALAACTGLAMAAPAAARPWGGWHGGWHHGWGWGGGLAAGLIGGAVAAATSPLWAPGYDYGYDYDYPGYAYGPGYAYAPTYAYAGGGGGGVGYCEAHFRSYNPSTGTYLGYDGQYHHCP